MGISIELATEELCLAHDVARFKVEESTRAKHRNFTKGGDRVQKMSVGIAAELAFAKWIGLPWVDRGFYGRKDGDVANVEVRSSEKPGYTLGVNDRDADDRPFVWVPRVGRRTWSIEGWYMGGDAKRDGKLYEFLSDTGEPMQVWFVPLHMLHPMEYLIDYLITLRSTAEGV